MEAVMLARVPALLALILLFSSQAIAKDKDKKKYLLPADVLHARTVLVVVSPEAGTSATDPNGNRIAQEEVEKAIMGWGRLTAVMEANTADLIIAVRKGYGKAVAPTITGGTINNRPIILEGDEGNMRIGGRHGPGVGGTHDSRPRPGVEVGASEDMFEVYRGGVKDPLETAPVWRYIAKNALRPPNVPAVAEFRKIVEEAEKRQKNP
jgi:hypothetical protein